MRMSDPLGKLGVRLHTDGGEIRIWSGNAAHMELVVFGETDPERIVHTVPLTPDSAGVFSGHSPLLTPGREYGVRADGPVGPRFSFDPRAVLLDPYARGIVDVSAGSRPEASGTIRYPRWRSSVVDTSFDWEDSRKPHIPLDRTVIYEAHPKGLTRLNPAVPRTLRGTYRGLGHDATIESLLQLGVTSVQLLPIQAFASERRLIRQGRTNYWGYNTVGFFAPHAAYASASAQRQGPTAVLREVKGMVKRLHEAGLEVILDVVYNHTAEEDSRGPRISFRGLDNASYYRQDADGRYQDVTGCGNTVNTGRFAVWRQVVDSVKYWAHEVQIDGFRFDLATAVARDESLHFRQNHPLLEALARDSDLRATKLIAEPWDLGPDGWQTGRFPSGWSEWNDRYRDRVRSFWLSDLAHARDNGAAPTGVGELATRIAGSAGTFPLARGPLASVNFVTAHDGFTLADLTCYNQKHNQSNGEQNRDGTNANLSFNHGVEGPTTDAHLLGQRARAMRNLMGTLLLSAGIPMITAGDEFGRSQAGNNNAYCHDSELTWLRFTRTPAEQAMTLTVRRLLQIRRENPALRPSRFQVADQQTPNASRMQWYDADGQIMTGERWDSSLTRSLQYFATSTPDTEQESRILLVVHGVENDGDITLPAREDVTGYTLLWDSATDLPASEYPRFAPGTPRRISGPSLQLYRVD